MMFGKVSLLLKGASGQESDASRGERKYAQAGKGGRFSTS